MKCIFLTRGDPPKSGFTLTLTGTFNTRYGYVKINDSKYIEAQTMTLNAGTQISVYVGGQFSSNAKITYNGNTVQTGAGTYTFALADNTIIRMTSALASYTADITTS